MSEVRSKTVVVLKSASAGKSWHKRTHNTGLVQGYRNFYGHGEQKFYIYPDSGWNEKKWGPKPSLGIIWADNEFCATREAYSKGLAPVNQTFGLIALKESLQ